jgi:hypothetical protein
MGKAGRPPLEPRIAELERKLDAMEHMIRQLDQLQRIQADHLSRLGVPRGTYQSAFGDKWPGNGNAESHR